MEHIAIIPDRVTVQRRGLTTLSAIDDLSGRTVSVMLHTETVLDVLPKLLAVLAPDERAAVLGPTESARVRAEAAIVRASHEVRAARYLARTPFPVEDERRKIADKLDVAVDELRTVARSLSVEL